MAAASASSGTLRIERRGGIAGLKPSVEHDMGSLSVAERAALDHVLRAPAAAAPAPTRGLPMPADRFTYRVTVTAVDGSVATRDVAEAALPEALERLSPRATP